MEIIWEKDLAKDSPLPWYLPLDTSQFSLDNFRVTPVGRFFTRNMVIYIDMNYFLLLLLHIFTKNVVLLHYVILIIG